jgi:hypothetical protein
MTVLKKAAVRWVILGLGFVAYWLLVRLLLSDDKGDANIGIGLLAFGLLLVGAGIGGLVDGLRLPLGHALLIWCCTAPAVGLTAAVPLMFEEPGLDLPVLLADLAGTVVFVSVLVAFPAIAAAAIGSAFASSRAERPSTS